jgi:Rab-like protein 2
MSHDLKIILLGDAASGKTKLMERFLLNSFKTGRLSTHALNIFPYFVESKYILNITSFLTLGDGRKWNVDFWDTAGQEQFNKLHPSYYFGAHACILTFDISRKITYKNLYVCVCMHNF